MAKPNTILPESRIVPEADKPRLVTIPITVGAESEARVLDIADRLTDFAVESGLLEGDEFTEFNTEDIKEVEG